MSSSDAIKGFWTFFEPDLAAISAEIGPPPLASFGVGVLALIRDGALENRWGPYLDNLRERGREAAQQRISFADWLQYVTRFRDAAHLRIERAARPELRDGMIALFDLVIRNVLDAYTSVRDEELERIEAKLRQTQKMEALGQLAGGVAHDFNNVLTVIKTCACFLEEDLLPNTSQRKDAIEIRRAAERATNITRQLLMLGGRGGGGEPRRVDIAELVADFSSMLPRLLGERVRLATSCVPKSLIVIDPGQLEQVILNLAVNARDAMPSGGRLTIETVLLDLDEEKAAPRNLPPGRYVELDISDTGVGMEREVAQRIFEPFFTTKDTGKGTGLGLAIVHGIVTQAHGKISVYSERGHGTTFRMVFPMAHGTAEKVPDAVEAPVTLPPSTVLVVDDQPEVRAIVTRVLQAAGCQVLEASTAEQARQICASHEHPIDVAVLDVVLTDGRGDALLDQLVDLRPNLAIVMMSGFPAGALESDRGRPPILLPKPFSPSELRAVVARAIVKPEVVAEIEPAPATRRRRILVADDDALVRKLLERGLRRGGFDVELAVDGREAIAALQRGAFDAVLTDVQMPVAGGLDLLREVRRVDLDIPVLMMSGQPDVASAATAIEYGAFRYLIKPLDIDELCRLMNQATRAHALAKIRREAHQVTSSASASAADRAGVEVRFDQAIAGLWMAFQPIIQRSGAPYGVEALMRSYEPSMSAPNQILEAATQLRRLPSLGRRVRTLAAAQAGDGMLFVNLHPEDLFDADLIDPQAPLTQIASRVVLEVTERAALTSSPNLTSRIARLREMGFRLAIDDIGAGYSGLTSFTEIMPEVVKLDMSLVRDVHRNMLKQRTISALCTLCHEVGSLVVGEGVETVDERDCLVALGCDLLQGYLIGRPARRE